MSSRTTRKLFLLTALMLAPLAALNAAEPTKDENVCKEIAFASAAPKTVRTGIGLGE